MNYLVSSFKVYIDKVNPDSWIIPRTRITPGNSCSGFYNYARTEYKDLEGYPEYI